MSPFANRCILFAALPLFLGGLAGATPLQAPARIQSSFAPIAGMELLPALQRATDVGAAPADQILQLAISMPFAQPAQAQAFVDSVSDPKSPSYRQFITPEEVGARFGLPVAQVEQLQQYLASQGFEISLVAKNRLAILASCTVAQAEQAFHTTIRSYTITPQESNEPATFVANSTSVQLPAELAGMVIDVMGLESFTRPKPLTTLLTPPLTRGCYSLVNMYNGGITGAGRTVGISNWDGFRANNWLLYISHFGLPVPGGGAGSNITTVPCNGGGLGAGTAGGEADLDIQMALGMAPLANIRIYDGSVANNLIGMLTVEVNENLCDTISESYGWNINTSTITSAHNQHVSMSAQGITYMAASGDSGTSIGNFGYPCMDPEVLSVGGTIANVNATTGARITEIGWSGSGGGWSTNTNAINVRPSWQVGNGVPAINGSNNKRLIPDVGFHAAGNGTGAYQFYFNNSLTGAFVGTSFACPVFAGALATTEQKILSLGGLTGIPRFGRVQDLFYGMNGDPAVWFDIVSGTNGNLPSGQGVSSAHAGWDTVCGWGPMNLDAFAPIAACLTGANCGGGVGTPFCFGDGLDAQVTTFCPCLNFGAAGHGCANGVNAAGALLTVAGTVTPDTLQFTSSGELNTSLSIFLQGTVNNGGGAVFGDGVRCAAGSLKRLFTHNASGGTATAPAGADLSVTARSAQLGDTILSGTSRYYQTYYRDPNLSFCTGGGFNISNGIRIDY
ncbi:MAG: S8 family serine peptidase [Planctomycetes bacterium]|nr:S8 family serine peptidase [Planctomycetota bacterium]